MPISTKSRLRRLYLAVFFLFLFMPCAQASEYHLSSEVLRFKVNTYVAGYWDGMLNIDELVIDPGGSVEIHNLSLADRKGRNWFEMKFARFVFVSDQNGFRLTEVRLEQPHLTMWFDSGELNWPVLGPSLGLEDLLTANAQYVEHLIIDEGAVTLAGENFNTTWDGLAFEVTQAADKSRYPFRLARQLPQSIITISGEADMHTRQIDADVEARYKLGKDETHAILTLLDVPLVHDVNAQLTANLRFKGPFNDSATFWPAGYVLIKDGIVNGGGGRLLENLKSKITFAQKGFISFDIIHASALSGRFYGVGFLVMRHDNTAWFGGHVSAADVNLAQFSQAIGNPKFFTKGRASARYDFTATSRDIAEHRGQGIIFLDDADLWKMPVISGLFSFLGTPLIYSDGIAYFKTDGPAVIFGGARITSPMTAIEFQRDAYVNWQTEFVDAHAVFVPLRKLRAITSRIPFFHIFTNLQDNLTRLRIRGFWSEPPSKLIRKEVIEDISTGTINFFTDAAQSGGQIGTEIMGRLKPLLATPSGGEVPLEAADSP